MWAYRQAYAVDLSAASARVLRAMDEVIVRPGNGLVAWDSADIWCFHRECQLSNFKLGSELSLAVKVNGDPDELTGVFFAKGAFH